jgi:hypothetical protein
MTCPAMRVAHAWALRYRDGRMTRGRSLTVLVILYALLTPGPAGAQETRAAMLERERAEKARALQQYEPGRLERTLLYIEQREPLRIINPHNGLFLRYAYPDRPTGAGMALGGGFRHDVFGDRARVVLEGGLSIRNYQLAKADFFLPSLAGGTLELGGHAAYHYLPQEDFYGLGPESRREDRVTFRYSATDYQGRALVRPRPWLELELRSGVLNPAIGPGRDKTLPQLTDRFATFTTPGLPEQPRYGYIETAGTVDRRDQRGNPRAGGFYHVGMRWYAAQGGVEQRFHVFDADLQHFFPIFDKKRVIALRGRVISSVGDDNGDVPFYFQPTLGGSDSLRSYGEYRFRDRNILFLNAEYRWEAFSGMDMALFSDWGKVATKHGNVDFGSLKRAYGIGFRFNTYKTVFLRFDIAAGGGEGMRYILKYSNVF